MLQVRHFDKKKSYLMFKENLFNYQKSSSTPLVPGVVGPGYLTQYEETCGEGRGEAGVARETIRQARVFKGSYRLVPYLTSAGS